MLMEARAKPLPAELCHANLCRMHPGLMDALDLFPGSLLLLYIKNEEKRSLVRVWLRSPGIGLSGPEGQTIPEIEIDPELMEYFALEFEETLCLESDFQKTELNSIIFTTSAKLAKKQISEIKQLIRQACWPIYPGAFFAVNLSGKPIDLMVTSEVTPPAVVSPATTVIVQDVEENQDIADHNTITALEFELQQVEKNIGSLEQEVQKIKRRTQSLNEEDKHYDQQLETLRRESDALREQLEAIPRQAQEIKEIIADLDQDIAEYQESLLELQDFEVQDFDLPAQEKKCRQLHENIQELFNELEQKGTDVFTNSP